MFCDFIDLAPILIPFLLKNSIVQYFWKAFSTNNQPNLFHMAWSLNSYETLILKMFNRQA